MHPSPPPTFWPTYTCALDLPGVTRVDLRPQVVLLIAAGYFLGPVYGFLTGFAGDPSDRFSAWLWHEISSKLEYRQRAYRPAHLSVPVQEKPQDRTHQPNSVAGYFPYHSEHGFTCICGRNGVCPSQGYGFRNRHQIVLPARHPFPTCCGLLCCFP